MKLRIATTDSTSVWAACPGRKWHLFDDQRVSRVYLTEAGRAVRADVQQVWRQLEEEVFASFTLEERVLLRRFFLHIHENLPSVIGGA